MLDYGSSDHGRFKSGLGDWADKIKTGQVQPPEPPPAPEEMPEPLRRCRVTLGLHARDRAGLDASDRACAGCSARRRSRCTALRSVRRGAAGRARAPRPRRRAGAGSCSLHAWGMGGTVRTTLNLAARSSTAATTSRS